MATLRDCKCGKLASRNDSNSGELLRIQILKSGTPTHPFTISHPDSAGSRTDAHSGAPSGRSMNRSHKSATRTHMPLISKLRFVICATLWMISARNS